MLEIIDEHDKYNNKYVLHQILQFGDFGVEQKETILAISDHLSEMIDYCINNNHKILEYSWCTAYITLNNKQVSRSEIIDTVAELYLDTEDRIKIN